MDQRHQDGTGHSRRPDFALIASVGGFFALRTGAPGPAHVPLASVYEGDHRPLTARVDTVAARLRAPERRIAASIAQLGLAARLWSVALGSAVLTGAVPGLDPRELRWDPDLTSPDDLVLTADLATARTLPATAASVREVVQYGHLVPLSDALRREGRISPRLLWGNAGSALAGAVRELSRWGERNGRPEVAERAEALAAELFGHPDLRTTGTSFPGTSPVGSFRRRSCCLYYRCPTGALCGDCVFDRPPPRSSVRAGSG
ncbi:IucA/IucC family C-terminal-domain containing protein [Streptomyces odonnellii]|uniref:IucA/IucC family C-terminal-domain containing protein n=1 Tax=Streptomyces odonnellii TaxID=1417980 RepID=UPI000626214D|nr:IucA/IucC family C-terminal-domain containing protein [Streptomyces odonnellii]